MGRRVQLYGATHELRADQQNIRVSLNDCFWPEAVFGNLSPPVSTINSRTPLVPERREGQQAPHFRHISSSFLGVLKAGVQKHVTAHLLVAAITPGTKSFTSGAILPK